MLHLPLHCDVAIIEMPGGGLLHVMEGDGDESPTDEDEDDSHGSHSDDDMPGGWADIEINMCEHWWVMIRPMYAFWMCCYIKVQACRSGGSREQALVLSSTTGWRATPIPMWLMGAGTDMCMTASRHCFPCQ
jgi:hypothetical protein